jgi:peptide/nickel transport system substrate-binding protein
MIRSAECAVRRRGLGLVAIAAAAALVVSGCGSSVHKAPGGASGSTASFYTGWPSAGTPRAGGTLVVDAGEGTNSLSPLTAATQGVLGPETAIYDQLVELMPAPGAQEPTLEPGLASSWNLSTDGLIYTFHIRPGVEFSNGEPLTAEDVAFSLHTESLPTAGGYTFTTDWKQISVSGPLTVTLTLKKPESATLELLNVPTFSIVPKRAFQREGATKFGLHPIGTGPFMLKSAAPGFTTITLTRNPHYWRAGKPYLDGLVFDHVESDNARILAARSGAADIAQQIPYSQVSTLQSTPGVKMLIGPEWGASFVVFNRAKAPFNDVNVRKALLYATPREEIIKSVYKGLGTGANSLWGQLKYWNSRVSPYPYNPSKAKELLKHSTVPNGFDMTLSITAGETQGELLAAILQSAYAKIGVHVSTRSVESTTLDADFFAGKTEAVAFPPEAGWSSVYEPNADAAFYLNNHEAGGFTPAASKKAVAELVDASTTTSEAEKRKLFSELQYQTLWQEALFLPIVNLVSLNLVSDKVRGYQVLPNLNIRWERAWLQG